MTRLIVRIQEVGRCCAAATKSISSRGVVAATPYLILLCALLLNSPAQAADIYVSQSGAGAANGSSLVNAVSVANETASPFESVGDRVILNGAITSQLTIAVSGVTWLFASNASVILPAAKQIFVNSGLTNITIDGGVNGMIGCSANGTLLANQVSVNGIQVSGVSNFVVKNLSFVNEYVHVGLSDIAPAIGDNGAILLQSMSGSNCFYNCRFTNCGWCIYQAGSIPNLMIVSNCSFESYDHGVIPAGTNWTCQNNFFGDSANWDTTADAYHHDAIHYYWGAYETASFTVSDNIFDGDYGNNGTAYLFVEAAEAAVENIWNNLFIMHSGVLTGDGCYADSCVNKPSINLFSNTFIGNSVVNTTAVRASGTNMLMKNNIYSSWTTWFYLAGALANSTINDNLYAAPVSGGNSQFSANNANYSSLAAWQSGTSQDANSQSVSSALLAGNFEPQNGSAAIGSGANLSSYFSADLAGHPRPATGSWIIGAYQVARLQITGKPGAAIKLIGRPGSPIKIVGQPQ